MTQEVVLLNKFMNNNKPWLKQVLADAKAEKETWPDWAKNSQQFIHTREQVQNQFDESSSDWNWREHMPDQYK